MSIITLTEFSALEADNILNGTTNAVPDSHNGARGSTVIGRFIQEPDKYQVITDITGKAESLTKSPTRSFQISVNRSPFGKDGAVTWPVTEYVQTWFPVSTATKEMQQQMEADFEHFNKLAFDGASGPNGANYVFGWVVEVQEHEELKGEKAKCWFMARGWESMELFEEFMQSQKAKDHLPILFRYVAPYKMWHVERKHVSVSDNVAQWYCSQPDVEDVRN